MRPRRRARGAVFKLRAFRRPRPAHRPRPRADRLDDLRWRRCWEASTENATVAMALLSIPGRPWARRRAGDAVRYRRRQGASHGGPPAFGEAAPVSAVSATTSETSSTTCLTPTARWCAAGCGRPGPSTTIASPGIDSRRSPRSSTAPAPGQRPLFDRVHVRGHPPGAAQRQALAGPRHAAALDRGPGCSRPSVSSTDHRPPPLDDHVGGRYRLIHLTSRRPGQILISQISHNTARYMHPRHHRIRVVREFESIWRDLQGTPFEQSFVDVDRVRTAT